MKSNNATSGSGGGGSSMKECLDEKRDSDGWIGILGPLKTTLETRRSDAVVEVYVTAVPVKGASDALSLIRKLLPDDGGLDFQHLRRFAKSSDVPEHVRESYAAARDAANRDHTTHSSSHSEPLKLFLIVGPVSAISLVVLKTTLSKILGDLVIFTTKVPLLAPTSQEQAKSWTEQYWPTVYKKSNPFGPHPSIIDRAEEEIRNEVEKWMDLAHQVASETSEAGSGERVGVVVVERKAGKAKVVAVAGDARWKGFDIGERRGAGNVTAHAVMRVIGIVAGALKKRDEESQDSIETAVEMTDDPRLDGATYSPSEYSSRSIDTPTLLHLRSSSSTHSRYTIDAENENDNLIATGSIAFVSLTSNLSTEIPKNKNEADSTLSIAADSSTNPIPRMEEIPKSSESDKEQDGASRRVSGAEVRCQDNREIFQDRPLLGVEKQHFDPDGNQNGYLCHDLEIYCTHEPCVMCSMAIVHSRFGRVIFERRMEKTGGMSADGELGHGLAWRKELNWTLLAWQWQRAADEEEKSNCGDLHA